MLTLKQDHSEFVVLAVLAESQSYGYAISKQVAARSDGHFKLTPSGLYPLLAKLEKAGLVTTNWEEVKASTSPDDAEGRKRKWYRLSAKGKRRLAQHAEAHQRTHAILNAFLEPKQEGTPA